MEAKEVTFNDVPQLLSEIMRKIVSIESKIDEALDKPPVRPSHVPIHEALEILQNTITQQTLYNWVHKKRVSTIKVGRKLLFDRKELEQMVTDRP